MKLELIDESPDPVKPKLPTLKYIAKTDYASYETTFQDYGYGYSDYLTIGIYDAVGNYACTSMNAADKIPYVFTLKVKNELMEFYSLVRAEIDKLTSK